MSVWPLLLTGVLAGGYIYLQPENRYIGDRITVLRIAALAICIAAAFVLDDATEETVGHVPTPLWLCRLVRAALAVSIAALLWTLVIRLTGDVPPELGGPLPVGDLTLEAGTAFVVSLSASSAGARLTADRLGGIVAAPVLLGLAALAFFLPLGHPLLTDAPYSPTWDDAHHAWRQVLVAAAAAFVLVNRDSGRYRIGWRARSVRAGRKVGRPRVT